MENPSKEQQKRWNKTYYLKNKEKRREQYAEYSKRLKEWYREIKSSLKCEECESSHPATLSFHHIDSSQKVSEVSTMVSEGRSRKSILEEINKCRVLCHNCHAIHHYNTSVAQMIE